MVEPRKLFGGLGNRLFQMAYIYGQMRDGSIPDMYLQSEEYWAKYKYEVRAMYREGLKEEKNPYVSLHIRRGDYLNNNFYVDLTKTDYYHKAIAMFPNETFLIFCADRQSGSDDVSDKEWCLNWAKDKGIKFIIQNGKSEIEDLNAMASCKAHIMANSSFSWWGAYLGGGKVIAPIEWFTDKKERIKLLDEWIKI